MTSSSSRRASPAVRASSSQARLTVAMWFCSSISYAMATSVRMNRPLRFAAATSGPSAAGVDDALPASRIRCVAARVVEVGDVQVHAAADPEPVHAVNAHRAARPGAKPCAVHEEPYRIWFGQHAQRGAGIAIGRQGFEHVASCPLADHRALIVLHGDHGEPSVAPYEEGGHARPGRLLMPADEDAERF